MKKVHIIVFLCLLFLLIFSSCSPKGTCEIKERDGLYYLTYPNWDAPNPPYTSSSLPSVSGEPPYTTIPEMMQYFAEDKVTYFSGFWHYPKTDGKGMHFFNVKNPLIPVLPEGFLEQPEYVGWGCSTEGSYDIFIDMPISFYCAEHIHEESEDVKVSYYFYHSKLDWTLG